MNKAIKKFTGMFAKISNNQRYFWVILFILTVFVINKNFFINYTVTSEDCKEGKCQKDDNSPEISGRNKMYYINDALNAEQGQYWRLVFEIRADKETQVNAELSKASDERMNIGSFNIEASDTFVIKEITFSTPNKYTDLVFEKDKTNDKSRIFIKDVNLTKLNIKNQEEFSALKPALIGRVNITSPIAEQLYSDRKFLQLKNKNTILGQIFKAQGDYISGVAFDMDITKLDNRGGKNYRFDLREAEFDGEIYTVSKNSLASLDFTVKDLENYRQLDGKIKFPIFSFLKRGEYYFVGVDTNKVKPNDFNFLTLRGSGDDKYQNGTAVVKKSGDTLETNGDLYFRVYGAEFIQNQGERILGGSIIEDIGEGQGVFAYKTSGSCADYIDIDSASSDVKYSNEYKNILGSSGNPNSYYIYKFYTVYPFRKISLKAEQADIKFNNVNLSYSLDGKKWTDIPDTKNNDLQNFELTIFDNSSSKKIIYLKITPKSGDVPEELFYGIKNLEVEGDLIIK